MVVKVGNESLLVCAAGALLALVLSSRAAAWTWPSRLGARPFVAEDDPYAGGQHRGIDIAALTPADVKAPATGVVSFAGQLPHEGLCLTIRTPDGFSITLVHLGSIGMPPGTAIEEGEVVGTIGPSGDPEWVEPYVHLGIRLTAEPHGYVDPLSLLPARVTSHPEPRPAEQVPSVAVPAPRQQGVEASRGEAGPIAEPSASGRRGLRVRARTRRGRRQRARAVAAEVTAVAAVAKSEHVPDTGRSTTDPGRLETLGRGSFCHGEACIAGSPPLRSEGPSRRAESASPARPVAHARARSRRLVLGLRPARRRRGRRGSRCQAAGSRCDESRPDAPP